MEFDTQGNKLTLEQIEYFKNTKIKDGDKLLVCQHVTSAASFDAFDISKSKHGRNGGIGFYFSINDNIYKPQSDQRVLYCYLNIEKMITEDTHYISDSQWATFIDKLWPNGAFPFKVSNETGDYINYQYLSKFYYGDLQFFLDCVTSILKVDGAYWAANGNDCVIAFRPEEIKLITNKAPTASNNMNEALDYVFKLF